MKRYVEKWKNTSKNTKVLLILASLISVSLLFSIASTLSWFTIHKKTAILAPVDAPQELYITAGNSEDVAFINLSGIDVNDDEENPTTCKDYVFCVKGSSDIDAYYIQLAHTTNIQFDYSIYKAEQFDNLENANERFIEGGLVLSSQNLPIATYVSAIDKVGEEEDSKIYYYPKLAELSGEYINLKNESGEKLGMKTGDDTENMKSVHDKTYERANRTIYSNDKVQKYAEPLYWHSGLVDLVSLDSDNNPTIDTLTNEEKEDGEFARYYILHIDWEGKGLQNNKETDMVYLTVATQNSVEN